MKDFDEIYTEEILNQESAALAEKMRVTQNGEITMDADQWSAVCKFTLHGPLSYRR